jgi:hypothetical protein
MEAKQPQLAVDQNLAPEQEQAQKTLIDGLQTQAQMDTANLMTRYGTRLALANGGLASTTAAATAAPPVAQPAVKF